MLNPFDSPHALLRRSLEHVDEMEARFNTFLHRDPCKRFVKHDPETNEHLHGVQFVEPIPNTVTVVAYDAVNALRSTLDHAVYASAVMLGHEDVTTTKFPFGDSADGVKSDAVKRKKNGTIASACHPVEEMRDYLVALHPHPEKGGNADIWALNKLRNVVNHRKLVRLGVQIGDMTISRGVFSDGIRLDRKWNATRDEFIYARTPSAAQSRHYLSVTAFLEIGETPFLGGKPATATFYNLAQMIEGIVVGIERETRRIAKDNSSKSV